MEFSKNEIKQIFAEWKENLTTHEKDVLYEYSKYSSDEINDFLENDLLNDPGFGSCPEDLSLRDIIYTIDKALEKFISNFGILVYRSEVKPSKKTANDLKELLEGMGRIEYKRFVSTSFTLEAAEDFKKLLKSKFGDTIYLFIKVIIPKGKKLGYLCKELSAMGDAEDEILVERNITFEIEKVSIEAINTVVVEGYFS